MANTMANKTFFSAAVVLFILNIFNGILVKAEDDDHGSNAASLDADLFESALERNRNFVMFYAPWCGHCKNLAPTWDELAKIFNKMEDPPVSIAKVDCTIHTTLCSSHDITGFPTLKLFEMGGKNHKRYTGKRDLDSLKTFVQEHLQSEGIQTFTEEEPEKPEVPEAKSPLVILDDDNFETLVSTGMFFIKFYAPWCGHCKKLAPVWDDLADTFSHTEDVFIAKIDCTNNPVTCKEYNIRGYPTLLFFKDGQKVDQYQGGRSHEALKYYVSEQMAEGTKADEEEEEVVEKPTIVFERGQVADLSVDTYATHLAEQQLVFVKFFAPWCGHCKRLAPTWEDLAKNVESESVSIAKVDCTQHKSVCDENQVRGYPTLKLFRNGNFLEDYKGSRSLEDLHMFVKRHLDHDEL